MIVAHKGSEALVKAEPGNRRIIVRVRGSESKTRRDLLALVRYDFDKIHSEDRMEVLAKVPIKDHPGLMVDYEKLVAF